MKIGFLLPGIYAVISPFNGVREQAYFQMSALEQLGHEVVPMSPWKKYDFGDFDVFHFFDGGLMSYRMESRLHLFRCSVFAPMIDSRRTQVGFRLMAKLGNVSRMFRTIQGEIQRQARRANLVIARSQDEKNRLVKGLGIDARKIFIVLNGVNPANAPPCKTILGGLDLPAEYALHVSCFTQPRKNVLRLIEAIGPTRIPLVIAGTSDSDSRLHQIKQQAEHWGNVRILGRVEHATLQALYAACKLFCLPSSVEGTGLAALEAASYGARVVITGKGGPPDYFLDMAEYTNYKDVTGIRAAILKAWHEPSSTRLRDHVVHNLTWEKSARQLLAAYKSRFQRKT